MDTENLSRWLGIGANIGVLFGIILLVIELDQNRDLMRAQTRHQISTEYVRFMSDFAYSPDMARIVTKSLNGEELSREEQVRYNYRLNSWFSIGDNLHYQYRSGLFDEEEFAAIKNAWKAFVSSNPRIGDGWCRFRHTYSPKFQAEFETIFADLNC